jgi:hypothetical protein
VKGAKRWGLVLLTAAVAALPAPAVWINEWPRINAKLAAKQVTIRKAVVLPAQVTFVKVGTRGAEGGFPESDQIARSFL